MAVSETEQLICWFGGQGSAEVGLVGGKAANLGLLSQAGFDVPPGFSVTTGAHSRFLEASGLRSRISELVGRARWDDPEQVDALTCEIRQSIEEASLPVEIAAEIQAAYGQLSEQCGGGYVAVRSSGTAEDLEETSFAGLHDSFLDVRGADAVLEAVKKCWASMWTSRATQYRHRNQVDHDQAAVAVVVQTMVESEASGVMFTGNPVTTATDEIVINASWGLGEAVVQGMVTPDEYVVKMGTLKVLEGTLGSKAVRIVRDRDGASGTLTEPVPDPDRARFCLTDSQVRDLAELGRRVLAYYEEFPQDIEWALWSGKFYLLQSRPITGVEFSWDIDVDAAHLFPEDDNVVWTRAIADEMNTGVVTPLTHSCRWIQASNSCFAKTAALWGFHDLANVRSFKYWKGELYYNADYDRLWTERTAWPAFREIAMQFTPPAWREDIQNAPFSAVTWLRGVARQELLAPRWGAYGTLKNLKHWRANRCEEMDGLPPSEIQKLSDHELRVYIDKQKGVEAQWFDDSTPGLFLSMRDVRAFLNWMCTNWYDGDIPGVFLKLSTGANERTATIEENVSLWELAEEVRASSELTVLFDRYKDGDFFAQLEASESKDCQRFLETYRAFLKEAGHRGHSDRDMFYPRRVEDPSLDYQAIAMLLQANSPHPELQEQEVNGQRAAVYESVLENIRKKAFGFAKVEIFKVVYDLWHGYIVARDNERARPTDASQFSYKRGFTEVGHRLKERGVIGDEQDIHYLSENELWELFFGTSRNPKLLHAKIKARKRDCERFLSGEFIPPKYLQRNRPVNLDLVAGESIPGVFQGTPESGGSFTGTARVVRSLKEIGTVNPGEILVANATDPGWSPVFLIVKAVVVQTGGMLSHSSCLTREYGLPCVRLSDALQVIPDGATITVNGDTGTVTLEGAVVA